MTPQDFFMEIELNRNNLAAHIPALPPEIHWLQATPQPPLNRFYTFHGKKCPDITNMSGPLWAEARSSGRYLQHSASDDFLDYSVIEKRSGDFQFTSAATPDTWIYLVSPPLPSIYAIEFDYTPHTLFQEQLQLDFNATSLANRHRYIFNNSNQLRYQRILNGSWLKDVDQKPFSLKLHQANHIRLEVIHQHSALYVNKTLLMAWQDRNHHPGTARNYLIFWNGKQPQPMNFSLANFSIEFPSNPPKHHF